MTEIKNPYLPLDKYMPDGEPHVFGDTLYVYGSCDIAGSSQFCLGEYSVAYAKVNDLTNWKYEKSYTFKDSNMTFEEGGSLQAPDCIRGLDGRYYLYYNRMKKNECEVAVSDSPKGPFKFYGIVKYENGDTPNDKMFDPGIFVEGNDVYLYVGFCPTKDSRWASVAGKYSRLYKLKEDMLTIKEGPINMIPGPLVADGTEYEGHAFYEASSMRKFEDTYYYIYSSDNSHDLCYAYSKFPDKDFKYGGILVSNCNVGYNGNKIPQYPFGNTHGSIEFVNGSYYVFYHRQTHDLECSHQAMAEKIELKNGKFLQAEMTTQGLNSHPLRDNGIISSAYACTLMKEGYTHKKMSIYESQKDLIPYIYQDLNNNYTHYIRNIKDEVIVGFKYFDFKTANHISIYAKGKAEVRICQSLDEEALATIILDGTKEKYELDVEFKKGVYPLYLRFKSDLELEFYQFELSTK